MPFRAVSLDASSSGSGKFTSDRRKLFNDCGASSYVGTLNFRDSMHHDRQVPIFEDECLEGEKGTYKLLKAIRKTMGLSFTYSSVYATLEGMKGSTRSIHQNENGYLPYSTDGGTSRQGSAAPAVMSAAQIYGELPHNQRSANAATKGQFLEYTFAEPLHVECRFIVDYRFGLLYMTLGHYDPESFALLSRSKAELDYEIKPTMSVLNVKMDG